MNNVMNHFIKQLHLYAVHSGNIKLVGLLDDYYHKRPSLLCSTEQNNQAMRNVIDESSYLFHQMKDKTGVAIIGNYIVAAVKELRSGNRC